MTLFGLFGASPEITIKLDSEKLTHKRILTGKGGELDTSEQCPIIYNDTEIKGQAIIRLKSTFSNYEHQGISIELIGEIYRLDMEVATELFLCNRLLLSGVGEGPLNSEMTILPFNFGRIRLPISSYDVSIQKRSSEIRKELTLWCQESDKNPHDEEGSASMTPLEAEVGLEEFLHIKVLLDKPTFDLTEEITGSLKFILVRVRIIFAEVSLIKKEILSSGAVIGQSSLINKQILDGPAFRGDHVPIHLDLASLNLTTPTSENINKTFSVKYWVGITLRDTEGRKYYRQIEVLLRKNFNYPNLKDSLSTTILREFKFGLVNQSASS